MDEMHHPFRHVRPIPGRAHLTRGSAHRAQHTWDLVLINYGDDKLGMWVLDSEGAAPHGLCGGHGFRERLTLKVTTVTFGASDVAAMTYK